jgi:TM2 domain-containing membrane protein YozV
MLRQTLMICSLVLFSKINAGNNTLKIYLVDANLQLVDSFQMESSELRQKPNPFPAWVSSRKKKNKKIVAALLAFPFPFGIVGLHRIYLGTSPYVPVAYIASLGGVFGILPFIDFCVLLMDKDQERYINNPKVFMWVR